MRAPGEPEASAKDDRLWHEHFRLEIAPHPDLTPTQRKVVAKDYGMRDGTGVISVRHAMLFYVLKRLNLLNDPEKEDPAAHHHREQGRGATSALADEHGAEGTRKARSEDQVRAAGDRMPVRKTWR